MSTGAPEMELIEEEHLALALKASMDTALEEQAARAAGILFDDTPGFLQFLNFFHILLLGFVLAIMSL